MEITLLEKDTLTNGDLDFSPLEKIAEVNYYKTMPRKDLFGIVKNSEYIICNKTVFDKEMFDFCPKLKYIGLCATGFNNIDLNEANERGITVCNVPGYSTDSVAQLTFTFLLALASNITKYDGAVKNGDWISSSTFSYFPYVFTEIKGKTLGIIGYGNIGRAVAAIAKAFGMKVLVSTRTPKNNNGIIYAPREELFKKSDFITLHCPLSAGTKGLICKNTLSLMKPTAFLINTSRGGAVVESDLYDALKNGVIAGAGLDVLNCEPMDKNNPLRNLKNCIVTPHIAWTSKEARTRLISVVAENLENYIKGSPVNTVNEK